MKSKEIAGVVLKKGLPAVVGLVVLVAVIAWLAGAFTKKIPPGPTAMAADELPVEPDYGTYKVQQIEKPYIEEAIGTLKAARRTELSSRVQATISRIAAGAGDTVAEGDVLIELDRKDFEARLSQTQAALDAADAATHQAQDVYDRAVRLRKANPGAIAEQDFNQMYSNLLTAQANQSGARQAVAESQVRLSYTTIKAPKSGTVVDRWAEEGDMTQPGVPLLSLYDRTSLRLEVPVMENLGAKIQKGDELEVHIDALDEDFQGVVAERVPQAEAATRSFLVKVSLPPSEKLYEGMFGRLKVPAGIRRHLCLHTSAIQQVGQLQFVTVIIDPNTGNRERRFVKTGRRGDALHREVLSGLEAGEQVLLVRPEPSPQSPPGPAGRSAADSPAKQPTGR
ncbi:MAG TPA: efflux RND transporter periplasmic adaptor subunit [Thermoguttaceae bacterium]|nr:efflux RND transporter periplasmic adaptor subunit [Thermoguttaceae bacterium]